MARNNVGKSKKKQKKSVAGAVGSGIRMKLKLLFSCMAFGLKPKRSSIDNNKNQQGTSPPHDDNVRDQVVESSPNTNNSSTPNNSNPGLGAYIHFQDFSYNDLKLATMDFCRENFLGEGGFGKVFKGWVTKKDEMYYPTTPRNGIPVAVKTLNLNGFQGHKEWLAELNYLRQLQHPKLVKIIGFCYEGDNRLLVYEFMPRGSLDLHLFRRSTYFPWTTRMKIMFDAAEGLAYLHQDDDKKTVIFRDFKTSNVLLDRQYNAKISDFGLATDGPVGDKTHVSTKVMGTKGYAAPEYLMTGHLTTKSDVYSFGVVLLEMITGKRVIDRRRPSGEKNFVPWVLRQIKDGGRWCHMVLVDHNLHSKYSKKGALKALKLAAKCVSENPSARPKMSEVVEDMRVVLSMVDDMYYDRGSPSSSFHHAMEVGSSSNSNLGTVLPRDDVAN